MVAPVIGLFGTGRSGSTWVGTMLASHPEVVYRFEPFHRMEKRAEFQRWRERIEDGQISDAELEGFYRLLLPAYPQIDKPPFFRKSNAIGLGKRYLWPVMRRAPLLSRPYSHLYTPRRPAPLVFKEVSMVLLFEQLAKRTSMRLVYLIRDPRGVVASLKEGQQKGLMPTVQWAFLRSLLQRHDPALAEQYGERLDELSPEQKNALLWRIEVERAVEVCAEHDNAMVVSYERMCEHPMAGAAKLFEHCGLELTPETKRFVQLSTSGAGGAESRRYGDSGGGRYFSVYRDPRQSMNKWKKSLSTSEVDAVLGVVEGSSAFDACDAGVVSRV